MIPKITVRNIALFILGFTIILFLVWLSGYDFDKRSPIVTLSLLGGIFAGWALCYEYGDK